VRNGGAGVTSSIGIHADRSSRNTDPSSATMVLATSSGRVSTNPNPHDPFASVPGARRTRLIML
jgi:hypothetical protein